MTIFEKLQKIKQSKQSIRASIEQMGVNIPEGVPFDKFADYIKQIQPFDLFQAIIPEGNSRKQRMPDGSVLVVFDDPETAGSITTVFRSEPVLVDMLAVGGGGAGGYAQSNSGAGGGGAGAFQLVQDVSLTSSILNVSVGAGGEPVSSASSRGGKGTDTFVTYAGNGVALLSAIGGGGGAGTAYSGSDTGRAGGDGGCGGGGTGHDGDSYKLGGFGAETQLIEGLYGKDGGSGRNNGAKRAGGGGGGVSVVGHLPSTVNSGYRGGLGGAGLSCDITGETMWYGGGGGGGNSTYTETDGPAPHTTGGSGVGGNGGGWDDSAADYVLATAGLDGTGSGGGGGAGKVGFFSGAAGGNGIVAMRFRLRS